jgi:hypothetical protein
MVDPSIMIMHNAGLPRVMRQSAAVTGHFSRANCINQWDASITVLPFSD